MSKIIFHLAFPVLDLKKTRKFYVHGLGCKAGRESAHSLILNFKENQIVAQKVKVAPPKQNGIYPRHFGLIFERFSEWETFLRRVRRKKLKFYQEPKVRFLKTGIEHHTFFLQDPSGNLLEFKYYRVPSAVFGRKSLKRVGDRS